MVVDLGDGAVGGLVGLGVDQRAHAGRHRVALDGLVAPAGDVEHHVIGGEVVAVRPLDALADMEGVLGGVVVDVPALDQLAGESAVAVVAHEIFVALARDVGNFRPVVGTRVLRLLDDHLHLEDAALLAFLGAGRGWRGKSEHAVGSRCRGAHGAGHRQEFAAAETAGLGFLRQAVECRRHGPAILSEELHLDSPPIVTRSAERVSLFRSPFRD